MSHFSQTRIKLKRTLSYFRNDNLFNFVIVLCGVDQWLIWPSAWNNYWFLSGGKSTNKYLLHCAVKCFQFCNWNQDLQKKPLSKYFYHLRWHSLTTLTRFVFFLTITSPEFTLSIIYLIRVDYIPTHLLLSTYIKNAPLKKNKIIFCHRILRDLI